MSKVILNKELFQSIKSLIQEARKHVVHNINTTMLITYFEIGRMIVEDEQNGKNRADYAKEKIKKLSSDLTKEFNRGYSVSNLEYFRKFYLTYQHRIPNTLSGKYPISDKSEKSQTVFGISQTAFSLSWSHFRDRYYK